MNWCKKLHNSIANNKISIEDIFKNTAKEIMNNYSLKIDELEIELTEIEFYYFSCDTHDDHYVHIDKLQKESCDFLYVHKKSYPRGGIDITFGNKKYYGGILIRGIKINDIFITGPAKIKKHIQSEISKENEITYSIDSYKSLQEYFNKNKENICLTKRKKTSSCPIYYSTRVGLKKEVDEKFYNAKYRFVREDYLDEKDKKIFESYSNLKERSKLIEKV